MCITIARETSIIIFFELIELSSYLRPDRPQPRERPSAERLERVPLDVREGELHVEGGVLEAHEDVVREHEAAAAEAHSAAGKAVEPGRRSLRTHIFYTVLRRR